MTNPDMTTITGGATVTVPVEPTREMLNAAIDVDSFKLGDISPLGFRISPQMLFEKCWSAMLAAAPALTAREEDAEVEDAIAFMERAAAMLYRGEMPVAGCQYAANWHDAHTVVCAALRARSAPEASPQVEAVAWRWRIPGRGWIVTQDEEDVVHEARVLKARVDTEVQPLYTHPQPAQTPGVGGDAVEAIRAERERQVEAEGWSERHDDEHPIGQLARAAGCYALNAGRDGADDSFFDCVVDAAIHHSWPWDRSWWKPKDRRSDLIRAGALIVAEIERLDRSARAALTATQPDRAAGESR